MLRLSRRRKLAVLLTSPSAHCSRGVSRHRLATTRPAVRRLLSVGLIKEGAVGSRGNTASVGDDPIDDADAPERTNIPRFIHFTLHKTNRETMDCLGHISRVLKVHNKDLSVCGTKDKRAVTTQRVSLKRGNWTLENVWRAVNGVKAGRRSEEEAVTRRGDRGTRIGDLCYAQKTLDLGMLKGNHFTITLRCV